jgi:hypothetical protein
MKIKELDIDGWQNLVNRFRKAYPPQKTEYYLGMIGETFEVWVIPDKGGAV